MSLQSRLASLISAIGADVKSNYSRVNVLEQRNIDVYEEYDMNGLVLVNGWQPIVNVVAPSGSVNQSSNFRQTYRGQLEGYTPQSGLYTFTLSFQTGVVTGATGSRLLIVVSDEPNGGGARFVVSEFDANYGTMAPTVCMTFTAYFTINTYLYFSIYASGASAGSTIQFLHCSASLDRAY